MTTHEETDAARHAAVAMFDGMEPAQIEAAIDEAMEHGCKTRFEIFRHIADTAGQTI